MSIRKMPKVSVLVINYNGKHYLRECFESLKNQTYSDYDMYIVDNGSTDGSARYVNEHFPWVRVIAFKENLGFARAYNEAIKSIDTDLVGLLNNDTRVDGRWLQELVNVMLEDKLVAAVGSKILLYDNPQLLNHAGARITPIGGGFDIGLYQKDCKTHDAKKEVGAVCGAAMLVRKNLFVKIGGFDEDFFAYFEDLDLCWRAWLYGFKILYIPTSVVYHKLGGSWGRSSATKVFLGERNRLLSMIKNLESVNLVKALFLSIPYNAIRIILYTRKVVPNRVFSIFKADLWVLRKIGRIMRKRKSILENRSVHDKKLFELGIVASTGECIREFLRLNLHREYS
jgi:GT2 family glycosyltransferase